MSGLNEHDFYGSIVLPMIDTEDIKDIADQKYYRDNNLNFTLFLESMVDSIIEDDRYLAKYGPTLLPILIAKNDSKFTHYIERIYNRCIELVKEDPERNMKFLSIITSSMNDLYKRYPDYITKFNSEVFMILDPFNERIEDNDHSHFNTFSHKVEIRKVYQFIIYIRRIIKSIFTFTTTILFLPFAIIYMIVYFIGHPSFRLLLHIFSDFLGISRYLLKRFIDNIFYMKQSKQQIVLIVPYIDYSCYPLEYTFWKELFYPQSNAFVNTCKKEFYTNWNGEAIINFKWKKFGRMYYFIIWLLFMIFLICFTIASYPTNSITQEVRISLYQTSIAFGFFHLIFFELRQFILDPKKYFSIWNLFGKYIYF
jgi:hypothetical protein